ncbi:MAG: NADH-quinone oxidoreductase subunit M [Nitrospirae bacterium]|nr:NADH-quinone oxidoreductase subunit M [Nitrospirota bacterium]
MMPNILSIITFLPLLGAVLLLFLLNNKSKDSVKGFALIISILTFFVSLGMLYNFNPATHQMQMIEKYDWIPSFGIQYYLGVDGISVLMILLTTFLSVVAVLASWKAIEERVKEYMISLLVLETGMLGVFVSLDFFLFYIFWELMLIPMYLIIGVWGGPRKLYAAVKFFLYTLAGSVLILLGILALYFAGGKTFDILMLSSVRFAYDLQWWVFLAFFIGFAIKVPMFPFHTWLPDAHVEAPTAGSIILAGVLLKMGAYGFLRFSLPMLPEAVFVFMPLILWLSIIAIIYGALVAMIQPDLKKLIAYSSVSHMGFVMLGIFALTQQGVEGGIIQMVNHGIVTGALFLCVGIIYERTHTRLIADYGGIAKVIPKFAIFFSIFSLASIGLPGMNGFIGEFMILLGAFVSKYVLKTMVVLASLGIILGAAYMLWMYQRVAFGEITNEENKHLPDIDLRETLLLVSLAIFVFWIGVYPEPFLNILHATVANLIQQVSGAVMVAGQ